MEKIRLSGQPLKEYTTAIPCRGFMTGFNEAFFIDTQTKEKLVAADPKSERLFRKSLSGQDIPLQARAAEARQLEQRVAQLVNEAYGLTAEEVDLMWRTAPPRMPGERPAG
jgi:hypothetical protein